MLCATTNTLKLHFNTNENVLFVRRKIINRSCCIRFSVIYYVCFQCKPNRMYLIEQYSRNSSIVWMSNMFLIEENLFSKCFSLHFKYCFCFMLSIDRTFLYYFASFSYLIKAIPVQNKLSVQGH